MSAKRIATACFLSLCGFLAAPSAHAYKGAVHFYATYVVASVCGIDEAVAIAWADLNVDRFPESDPGTEPWNWLRPSKHRDRRVFHFPVLGKGRVEPGSAASLRIAEAAFIEAKTAIADPLFLGIALHVHQDSWAHAGFEPKFGHLWSTSPDYTHAHPEAADQMVLATWEVLNRWRILTQGVGCAGPAEAALGIVSLWNRYRASGKGDLQRHWRAAAETLAGHALPMKSKTYETAWNEGFLKAVERTKLLFPKVKGEEDEDPPASPEI